MKRSALACVAILFALLAAEVALRVLQPGEQGIRSDVYGLGYRFDPNLGWFPIPNRTGPFVATRVTTASNNARGFRDVEHIVDERPGILFLGDSFVWGYDVEQGERFTDRLAARLPGRQVFNLGVSGYGTDQEYLVLEREIDDYRPQIVFLVFCADNDRQDNSTNIRYGGAFKPYCVVEDGEVRVTGQPVPRSKRLIYMKQRWLYNIRVARLLIDTWARVSDPPRVRVPDPTEALVAAIRESAEARGARFVVGLQDHDAALEGFLDAQGIDRLDLATDLTFPGHGEHWTPEGHEAVSERVYAYLVRIGFVAE